MYKELRGNSKTNHNQERERAAKSLRAQTSPQYGLCLIKREKYKAQCCDKIFYHLKLF